ncbi:MAG: hypothetical protein LBQ66_05235 [Planctomycetaceae bacterium]|jgi:hypothetical protein|nr:hypothetical protein [Planctomycetaceae bacterium]
MSEIEKNHENQEQIEQIKQIERDKTKQKQKRKIGCLNGCLPGLIVLVLFWWYCVYSPPLRISPETTYITSPKTSDGKYVDYFLAIEERYYPPEMETDNNGYRLIVRAFGDLVGRSGQTTDKETGEIKQNITELLRRQVYEKLGLDPDIKPTLKIESALTFLNKKEKGEKDVEKKSSVKFSREKDYWTIDEFPELKEWLDANNAGIDLIGEAVRKPTFRMPLARVNENVPMIIALDSYHGYNVLREFARAVRNRADYRIGVGDIDGAIYDVMTLHYLGYHTGKHGTIIGTLMGIAISGVASSTAIGANPDHPLTKEQLERWAKELNALPPKITFAETMESERLYVLALTQDQYRGILNVSTYMITVPNGSNDINIWKVWQWCIDINVMLSEINKKYDSFNAGNIYKQPLERMTRNPLAYISVRSRTKQISRGYMNLVVGSVESVDMALQRSECVGNMQLLTLALLMYEKEHGKLPDENWQEAIRPYLGDNPDKLFCCPTSGLADRASTMYRLTKDDKKFILTETELQVDDSNSSGSIKMVTAMHNGGANFAYKNGAVKFISPRQLQKEFLGNTNGR